MAEIETTQVLYHGSFEGMKEYTKSLGFEIKFIEKPVTLQKLSVLTDTSMPDIESLTNDARKTIRDYLSQKDADLGYITHFQRGHAAGNSSDYWVDVVVVPVKLEKISK